MIAAQCSGQLMAPFTVEGACNRAVFEIWLETCLIPMLKPGQVVVMDNATFHKGGRIELLIQEAGCELLYLPAYWRVSSNGTEMYVKLTKLTDIAF